MSTERDILLNIYADVSNNLEHIKTSRTNLLKIKGDILNLNNNYFDAVAEGSISNHSNDIKNNSYLLNDYMKMYDDISTYQELITNLENLKTHLKQLIKHNCEHNWVHDYIDIDPDRSKQIFYCSKCEITKK